MSTDEIDIYTPLREEERQMSTDEIVPADPQREDGQISIDVNAPQRVEMHRADTSQISTDHETDDVPVVKRRSLREELCDKQTYIDCLDTCFFFFFCHAITSLILSITVCCRCYTSMLKMPDRIAKRTSRTHKVFAFFAKNLSALWVSSLLVLFARWVLFRPIDVTPRLISTVHEFELLQSRLPAPTHLRFNVTAYVLFHNGHMFYRIHYRHCAGSVLYAGVKLGPADNDELPSFAQKPYDSTPKRLPFVGRLRNASGTVEETFARERAEGRLQMLVRIRVSLNYGFWPFKADYFTIYDCPLRSPFPRRGEPGFSSQAWCNTLDI